MVHAIGLWLALAARTRLAYLAGGAVSLAILRLVVQVQRALELSAQGGVLRGHSTQRSRQADLRGDARHRCPPCGVPAGAPAGPAWPRGPAAARARRQNHRRRQKEKKERERERERDAPLFRPHRRGREAAAGWAGVLMGCTEEQIFRELDTPARAPACQPTLPSMPNREHGWRVQGELTDAARQARAARLETDVKVHIHWKRMLPNGALHTKHA